MEEPPQTSAPDLVKKTDATIVAALTGKPVAKDGEKAEKAASSSSSSTTEDNNVGASVGGTATPEKNEAAPSSEPQTALPAPAQVNDASQPDPAQSSSSEKSKTATSEEQKKADESSTDTKNESTSKKKKKGLFRKMIPF
jgi:hypothetical protein